MKVYVAGRWTRRAEASAFMREVEARGHTITHDWTVKDEDAGRGQAQDAERSVS